MSFVIDDHMRKQLEDEIWGDNCYECNFWGKPKITGYYLKKEEVYVISCSECDATIVVIELEKKTKELVQKV